MFKLLIFGAGAWVGWRAHAEATVIANKAAILRGDLLQLKIPGVDIIKLRDLQP